MKRLLLVAMLAAAGPALADVGVSVSVGGPGYYGTINLGDEPAPQVIYTQPVVVEPPPGPPVAPIYVHVPPGYERHWRRHCAEYGACGRPVFFVRDDWYQREYVPRHYHPDGDRGSRGDWGDHDHGDHGHGHGGGHGGGHGRDW